MQASSSQGSTRGRVCRALLQVFFPRVSLGWTLILSRDRSASRFVIRSTRRSTRAHSQQRAENALSASTLLESPFFLCEEAARNTLPLSSSFFLLLIVFSSRLIPQKQPRTRARNACTRRDTRVTADPILIKTDTCGMKEPQLA